MNTWITSDLHLNHANILKYCRRPFKDVHEMNEVLISNWNARIEPGDVVYILGDLIFGRADYLINRLNGQKNLIRGNHDKKITQSSFGFVKDTHMISAEGYKFWLSHYAHLVWPKKHHGALHLFGHSHGNLENPAKGSMDVGVDTHSYRPYSIGEIISRLT